MTAIGLSCLKHEIALLLFFYRNLNLKVMKPFIFMVAIIATTIAACSNPQKSNAKTVISSPQSSPKEAPQNASLGAVMTHYLHLKNALASDNTKEAATASAQLHTALAELGKQLLSSAQKKAYSDISADALENAQHIADNGGNIKHQREHFQGLSEDIYDLIKAFGTSQTLYKDYCPMAKATWVSEVKDIKNPYLGKSMPTCGSVKETISQK
jgi:hypothetical protein